MSVDLASAPYPVRYDVDYPTAPRNRLTVFFRLILVIPMIITARAVSHTVQMAERFFEDYEVMLPRYDNPDDAKVEVATIAMGELIVPRLEAGSVTSLGASSWGGSALNAGWRLGDGAALSVVANLGDEPVEGFAAPQRAAASDQRPARS